MTHTASSPTLHATIHALLSEAEQLREAQLADLPVWDGDLVAQAQRAHLERVRSDIRAAIARVAAGTYGICTGCACRIPAPRLEALPWTAWCVRCASR